MARRGGDGGDKAQSTAVHICRTIAVPCPPKAHAHNLIPHSPNFVGTEGYENKKLFWLGSVRNKRANIVESKKNVRVSRR